MVGTGLSKVGLSPRVGPGDWSGGAQSLCEHFDAIVLWDIADDPRHLSCENLHFAGGVEAETQRCGVGIRIDAIRERFCKEIIWDQDCKRDRASQIER